jgi:hypothetical protein
MKAAYPAIVIFCAYLLIAGLIQACSQRDRHDPWLGFFKNKPLQIESVETLKFNDYE